MVRRSSVGPSRKAPSPRSLWWVAILVALAVLASGPRVEAATPLFMPAAAGTQWQIASGYNTVTHSVANANDSYAIDIVRTDAPTDGTAVLAPFDGTVRFTSASCLSITDAASTTALLCHLFPVANLRGRAVVRGQLVGVVAPAGQASNNGLAHIHMALSTAARAPLPFDGAYVLDGTALPATATPNAYGGVAFTSTNAPALSVDVGPDLQVRPGAAVTLTARVSTTTGITYAWRQTAGPIVSLAKNGAIASFTAPGTNGVTLAFEVVAVSALAQTAGDTVSVRTSLSAPAPPAPGATGAFVATPVFGAQRVAVVVYAGGSVDQLEAAARAASASGAWVQDASGAYQLLVVDGPAFLNATFRARFASGFATAIALTLTRP